MDTSAVAAGSRPWQLPWFLAPRWFWGACAQTPVFGHAQPWPPPHRQLSTPHTGAAAQASPPVTPSLWPHGRLSALKAFLQLPPAPAMSFWGAAGALPPISKPAQGKNVASQDLGEQGRGGFSLSYACRVLRRRFNGGQPGLGASQCCPRGLTEGGSGGAAHRGRWGQEGGRPRGGAAASWRAGGGPGGEGSPGGADWVGGNLSTVRLGQRVLTAAAGWGVVAGVGGAAGRGRGVCVWVSPRSVACGGWGRPAGTPAGRAASEVRDRPVFTWGTCLSAAGCLCRGHPPPPHPPRRSPAAGTHGRPGGCAWEGVRVGLWVGSAGNLKRNCCLGLKLWKSLGVICLSPRSNAPPSPGGGRNAFWIRAWPESR